jgi:hypothetical protein
MAASIIMAGVGGKKEVSGNKMAIPEVGPIPGRTPTRVPRIEPMSANRRFVGVRAWINPLRIRSTVDMA